VLPAQRAIEGGDADRVAKAHCDERRKYIRERGAVRSDRTVVKLGIGRPPVQGAARPHLPGAEYDRYGEGGERQPEVREDESAATEHSSPPSACCSHRLESWTARRRARAPTSPGARRRRIRDRASSAHRDL